MFTPLERLVLGCIGVFASVVVFYFLWIYFILFQLLFPTTVFILGAPLQQQTELQLLFGCCQQQAEGLVAEKASQLGSGSAEELRSARSP